MNNLEECIEEMQTLSDKDLVKVGRELEELKKDLERNNKKNKLFKDVEAEIAANG